LLPQQSSIYRLLIHVTFIVLAAIVVE
jgi:hypothetical protein